MTGRCPRPSNSGSNSPKLPPLPRFSAICPLSYSTCQSPVLDPLPTVRPPSCPRMPLFAADDSPLLPEAEQQPAEDRQIRPREQDSPSLSLTGLDGRPISRGELIQRLKRGESPSWSLRF